MEPRIRRVGSLSELGMVVAGKPARALQPSILRSERQAVGSDSGAGLVERVDEKSGSGTMCPTSKPDSAPSDHMGPFIMNPEGVGRIFVPLGMVADGPSRNTTKCSKARRRTCCIRSRTIIR